MPYLGNVPAEAYTNTVKDSFNGDGSTTAFTLSQPSTTNNLRVVVENVIQDPTVAYSCSGTTLTFTSAPPSGTANIYAVHLGPAVQSIVPPTTIEQATTYTSALTVQGAFTSPGIDDNANAIAMTIDSSERVLIGHTTANGYALDVAKANLGAAGFNRTGTDGEIAGFMKDGTTVGSIGSVSGSTYYTTFASGVTGSGIVGGDGNILLSNKNGASTDGSVDLGASNKRVRNLYLSGGVYLGGTASSNLIDIYEEGSWTPSLYNSSGSSVSVGTASGRYTRIGNMITIWMYLYNVSASFQYIMGHPTANSTSLHQGVGSILAASGGAFSAPLSTGPKAIALVQGNTQLKMDGNYFSGGQNIWLTMNYRAP